MSKRTFADMLLGGVGGATGGAQAGAAFGPYGSAIGGGAGLLLGGLGGLLGSQADEPFNDLNMQEQGLNNSLLQQQLQAAKRTNREADATARGLGMFRNFLGAAFKTNSPASFGSALKTYPGLGNQGTP